MNRDYQKVCMNIMTRFRIQMSLHHKKAISKITDRSNIIDKIVAASVTNDAVVVGFNVSDGSHLASGTFLCLQDFSFNRGQIRCRDYGRMGEVPHGLERILQSFKFYHDTNLSVRRSVPEIDNQKSTLWRTLGVTRLAVLMSWLKRTSSRFESGSSRRV
jgi:hypothetical protein